MQYRPTTAPLSLDEAAAVLRDAPDVKTRTDLLEQQGNSALTRLCRRFGLIQTGSMEERRQRLLRATAPLDRDALAEAMIAGAPATAGLRAHITAALGQGDMGLSEAGARAVLQVMDDVTLRRLLPGSPFAMGYSALRLLFFEGGRQYAFAGSSVVYRTETSSFRFYCTAEEWPASEAMRRWQERHPQ